MGMHANLIDPIRVPCLLFVLQNPKNDLKSFDIILPGYEHSLDDLTLHSSHFEYRISSWEVA